MTALALISRWINPDNKKFNEYSSYGFDIESYSPFFELIKSLRLKEQKVDIFKYYKYAHDVNDNKLVKLIRIKEPENHKRLPSKIYLPIEIFMEFDG